MRKSTPSVALKPPRPGLTTRGLRPGAGCEAKSITSTARPYEAPAVQSTYSLRCGLLRTGPSKSRYCLPTQAFGGRQLPCLEGGVPAKVYVHLTV